MISKSTGLGPLRAVTHSCRIVSARPSSTPDSGHRQGRDIYWCWLESVSNVTLDLEDDSGSLTLSIVGQLGFIRAVDRNAITVEIPRGSAIHLALSQPSRRQDITLWCRNPGDTREIVRLQGVGSVGPASHDANQKRSDKVIFRMTTFDIFWGSDDVSRLPSSCKEAS